MVAVYYAGLPVPPQRIALDVSKNLAREVQRLDEQAALILSDLEDGNRWSPPASRTYSFFLFESSRLIEWSSNDFVPTAASVGETFSIKLLKAGNGNYLVKKWKLKDARFLVGVVLLIRNFSNITIDDHHQHDDRKGNQKYRRGLRSSMYGQFVLQETDTKNAFIPDAYGESEIGIGFKDIKVRGWKHPVIPGSL